MKPSVYIETSVVSYLTLRKNRNDEIAKRQDITRMWWKMALSKLEPFVCQPVLTESSRGNRELARERLLHLSECKFLEIVPEVSRLATKYMELPSLPEKADTDALHIAVAPWHGMDYLVSWNMKHIVNGRVQRFVRDVNEQTGIRTPIICTPEELLEP
jgi:predicted nucleic acid-binding protein